MNDENVMNDDSKGKILIHPDGDALGLLFVLQRKKIVSRVYLICHSL